MLHWVSLIVLAFAISLDGFGVGMTYGLRKIAIPLRSIIIISICSALVILLSMQIGSAMTGFMPVSAAKAVGASILVLIGGWTIFNVYRKKEEDEDADTEETTEPTADAIENTVLKIEIKQLGVVIQILKKPSIADFDQSGSISPAEAAVLGIALSLDAFGAGVGAALIDLEPLPTAVISAGMSGLFLYLGLKLGFLYANKSWIRSLSYLPGIILIFLGIMRLTT